MEISAKKVIANIGEPSGRSPLKAVCNLLSFGYIERNLGIKLGPLSSKMCQHGWESELTLERYLCLSPRLLTTKSFSTYMTRLTKKESNFVWVCVLIIDFIYV